jgi:aralkylamine N-acetyltransferase
VASAADAGLDVSPGGLLAAEELRALHRRMGWREAAVDDHALQAAIDRTWNVTVRDAAGELVAVARLLDDGALYATIWDMLVVPEHRRRGLATRMLELLLERCRTRHIVALVATPQGRALYERAGFASESRGSTGMLMRPEER